jgi:hypothetical protein
MRSELKKRRTEKLIPYAHWCTAQFDEVLAPEFEVNPGNHGCTVFFTRATMGARYFHPSNHGCTVEIAEPKTTTNKMQFCLSSTPTANVNRTPAKK